MALSLFLIVGAFKNTAVGRSDSIYDKERCDGIWNLGTRSLMSDIFTQEELIDRAFHRAAYVMKGMWEEYGSSDTRLLMPPLIPDEYVLYL